MDWFAIHGEGWLTAWSWKSQIRSSGNYWWNWKGNCLTKRKWRATIRYYFTKGIIHFRADESALSLMTEKAQWLIYSRDKALARMGRYAFRSLFDAPHASFCRRRMALITLAEKKFGPRNSIFLPSLPATLMYSRKESFFPGRTWHTSTNEIYRC